MKHHRHINCLPLFVAMLTMFASGQLAGSESRGAADPSQFSAGTSDHFIHVMQTNDKYAEIGNSPMTTGVTYHGGPVVTTPNLYAIFWNPPTLQNGTPTSMSSKFLNTLNGMLAGYEGHGLGNNLTQYYSTVTTCSGRLCTSTQYNVLNTGKYAGNYVDASPYPAAGWGCQQSNLANCISDDQVQAEITKVMGLKGWSAGLNNIFLLFTSLGETLCTNETPTRCDFVNICAYHGQWPTSTSNVLYAPLPYMDPTFAPGCQVPNPPNDAAGDSTANAASHEIAETITNPLGNAWISDGGEEVGDLCGSNMGTNTWDNGLANQYWSEVQTLNPRSNIPVYFELQMIWDQHTQSCVQVGP